MDGSEKIGRFVLFRDIEGRMHALSPTAVSAICDTGDGSSVLLLPGGKVIVVEHEVPQVAAMLSGISLSPED